MSKELIIKKRVRFVGMNFTSTTAGITSKQIKRESGDNHTTELTQPVATTESNIPINSTKINDIKNAKIVEKNKNKNKKREDEKIEINFKDFENTEVTHDAISPNFWQKFKKFTKARIPILCRLFSKYESAIENLMASYLNVGGLSAHKAIQNYCLSKISDNPETSDTPKGKMSGILSWVNGKLKKIAGKSKPKTEEVESDEQNLSIHTNKLNIVIVSPESANIKQVESINDNFSGDDDVDDIQQIAMDDLRSELWDDMNEAKNEDIDLPIEPSDESLKKKRSCFGFKCLNDDEENTPKNLMAEDNLNNLNALSIAINDYDKSYNHLNMGKSYKNEKSFLKTPNTVPEIENKRKTEEKIDNFLQDLSNKKHFEDMHRPFDIERKTKNVQEQKETSIFQNLTNFKEFNSTTIYFCVFSLVFLIIFLILLLYICHRRKLKNVNGSNSSKDKHWYRRGEIVDDFSDAEDHKQLVHQLNYRSSRPPSLEVKGDRKSRKQSYLDDFKPVGPFQNKGRDKNERMHLIESENESLNESDYEVNSKYKTSGTVTN